MHLIVLNKHGYNIPDFLPKCLQPNQISYILRRENQSVDFKSRTLPIKALIKPEIHNKHVKSNSVNIITNSSFLTNEFCCFVPTVDDNTLTNGQNEKKKEINSSVNNYEDSSEHEPLMSELSDNESDSPCSHPQLDNLITEQTKKSTNIQKSPDYFKDNVSTFQIEHNDNFCQEESLFQDKVQISIQNGCQNIHANSVPPCLPPRNKHGRSVSLDLTKIFANVKTASKWHEEGLLNPPAIPPKQILPHEKIEISQNGDEKNQSLSCTIVKPLPAEMNSLTPAELLKENAQLKRKNIHLIQRIKLLENKLLRDINNNNN